jgi:hypothetical protein
LWRYIFLIYFWLNGVYSSYEISVQNLGRVCPPFVEIFWFWSFRLAYVSQVWNLKFSFCFLLLNGVYSSYEMPIQNLERVRPSIVEIYWFWSFRLVFIPQVRNLKNISNRFCWMVSILATKPPYKIRWESTPVVEIFNFGHLGQYLIPRCEIWRNFLFIFAKWCLY